MHTELSAGGRVLWSGPWQWEVRCNGLPAAARSPWEVVCRVSDADVDYLELQIELAGGLRIERHLVLARLDRFLLLADAVLGDRPAELQYFGRLSLCRGISFRRIKGTAAGRLFRGNQRLATVLPLGLPASGNTRQPGRLSSDRQAGENPLMQLQLQQAAHARRMFAPLWFDLDPNQTTRRLTWRPLSIGQAMQLQPADVAVGYRVAAGKRQWLVYRSLGGPGNRTLLGHNLVSETLVARFHRNGRVQPLIEVE